MKKLLLALLILFSFGISTAQQEGDCDDGMVFIGGEWEIGHCDDDGTGDPIVVPDPCDGFWGTIFCWVFE